MKGANLDITVEANILDFLGVNIDCLPDGSYHLSQPKLIDSILDDLRLSDDNVVSKSAPMSSNKLPSCQHPNLAPHDGSFHYGQAIGKLNCLEKSTGPGIAYPVHQCARFSIDPKMEHASAVRWIGWYLQGMCTEGFIICPNSTGLEVFVDADFSGNWDSEIVRFDKDTARSRYGYFVMFSGCPIVWALQLQMETALSSTESEVTGLSYALRSAIPMMCLMNELKQNGFKVPRVKLFAYFNLLKHNLLKHNLLKHNLLKLAGATTLTNFENKSIYMNIYISERSTGVKGLNKQFSGIVLEQAEIVST
jgi:hypothetical protein